MRPQVCVLACLAVICGFAMSSCGAQRVTRNNATTELKDLSGKWNAEDSRQVAEVMIDDALTWPWHKDFQDANNRKPMVQIGEVIARSNTDVIDTDIFTDDLRRAFIKSRKVGVVAKDDEMNEMRQAQKTQEERAREETRSKAFAETGADFRVIGTIKVQDDRLGNEVQKFYSVDLIMTNIETGEQVWIGNHKIAKTVQTNVFR